MCHSTPRTRKKQNEPVNPVSAASHVSTGIKKSQEESKSLKAISNAA